MQQIRTLLLLPVFVLFAGLTTAIAQNSAQIGDQVWTSENLNVSYFRNGDPIPQASSTEAWVQASQNHQPAWCYYNNDPANGSKYGKLYNFFAVTDPRGLAPEGWHIPSDDEWKTLINYFGGEAMAGIAIKSRRIWRPDGNFSSGSGFEGLPAGRRLSNGAFIDQGHWGIWWTASGYSSTGAYARRITDMEAYLERYNYSMRSGFPVRCVRDLGLVE